MALNSSIFSSEPWRGLVASRRTSPGRNRAWSLGLFALTLPFWLFVLIIRPEDLFRGRFRINSEIRTAHDPLEVTFDGSFRATQDGLLEYVSEKEPIIDILVIGASNLCWYSFPRRLEEESIRKGRRVRCFNAAIQGMTSYEVADNLNYILGHNHRKFAAVLIKTGLDFSVSLYGPPGQARGRPSIGSGESLLYSGAPSDSTRVAYWDHYRAAVRRRGKDFFLQKRNRIAREAAEYCRPSGKMVFSTTIPEELQPRIEPLLDEYEKVIQEIITICRFHSVRPIFLTNARRVYLPDEKETHERAPKTQVYLGKYSVLTFDYLIVQKLNLRLEKVCREERVQLIDYAKHLLQITPKGMATREIFMDSSHLRPDYEYPMGRWIYHQLIRGGL
ncbi:MAG: hypothetical protein KC944_00105 [Candidatus Omnitrophica bacterium]|nr:hypothetical protein [Candidatus Omnitrophota bacterium]